MRGAPIFHRVAFTEFWLPLGRVIVRTSHAKVVAKRLCRGALSGISRHLRVNGVVSAGSGTVQMAVPPSVQLQPEYVARKAEPTKATIVATSKGLVIVTGCAHPGVVNIIRVAEDTASDDRVYFVMGGFHLAGASPAQILNQLFKSLDAYLWKMWYLVTAVEMRRAGCSGSHMGNLTWKAGWAKGYHFRNVRGVRSRNS